MNITTLDPQVFFDAAECFLALEEPDVNWASPYHEFSCHALLKADGRNISEEESAYVDFYEETLQHLGMFDTETFFPNRSYCDDSTTFTSRQISRFMALYLVGLRLQDLQQNEN